MIHNYVYIILRKDLPNSQKVVQSSHVSWEISKKYNLTEHPSIIVIGVENEIKLLKESDRITNKGFEVTAFYEPLFNDKLSCIAIFTNNDQEREFFKRYNLLSNESFYTKEEQERIKLKNCTHKKVKPSYKETLAYEFYPVMICCNCGKEQKCSPSEIEKISLLKDFYSSMDFNLTEEQINMKKEGFNL